MNAATEVLKQMESRDITPTIRTYSILMYAYAVHGDIECIRKTLAECKDKNIWIPDKVFLKIIYHLSSNGFKEPIDEVLNIFSFFLYKHSVNLLNMYILDSSIDH